MKIIIGNIIALIASIIMVYSGTVKNKKKIIYFQTVQIGLSVISNIILGGITGAIINAISFVRNIWCYKDKLNIVRKCIIATSATILSITLNNLGLIGFLPVISTVTYVFLMDTKSTINFKFLIIFTMSLWFVYDLTIKSYTSAIFDLGNIIANSVTIVQLKSRKETKNGCTRNKK